MSREYDAQSKVPNEAYRDNFDRIFGKKPSKSEARRVAAQKGETAPEALAESLERGTR